MEIAKWMEKLGEKKGAFLQNGARCGNAGELQELAAENGISLNREEAAELLEAMEIKSDALSDEELDGVAGGGVYLMGDLVVVTAYGCEHWSAETEHLWVAIKGQCGSCWYYTGFTCDNGLNSTRPGEWRQPRPGR